VTTPQTIVLGTIAGSTIFLGLPLGRLRNPRPTLKAFLNAGSAGILLFLMVDIFANAVEPLEAAARAGSWGRVAGLGTVFALGVGTGLLSLLYLGKWQRGRRALASVGPGAMSVVESAADVRAGALSLGMSIATGIGLHNFSEGLAIGQTAHTGQIQLAVLLVVGFALHNATEGFGIVGPLAAGGVRASWSYLAVAGLVGGGPTFLGTLVGTVFSSQYVSVLFLTLAAGAIVYVISELLNVGRKLGAWDVSVWGLLTGFLVGVATEIIIVAAGA
jgi:zinc transporter, ZIP family